MKIGVYFDHTKVAFYSGKNDSKKGCILMGVHCDNQNRPSRARSVLDEGHTGAGSHFGVLKGIKIQHFFRCFSRLYSLENRASKYTPFLDVRQAKVTSGIGSKYNLVMTVYRKT